MKMTVLTVDNIEDYRDFIGADMAENIGRNYYRGLIAEDGSECLGGIIWQYKNAGNECESFIECFFSEKLLPRGFGIPVYVGNRSEG